MDLSVYTTYVKTRVDALALSLCIIGKQNPIIALCAVETVETVASGTVEGIAVEVRIRTNTQTWGKRIMIVPNNVILCKFRIASVRFNIPNEPSIRALERAALVSLFPSEERIGPHDADVVFRRGSITDGIIFAVLSK